MNNYISLSELEPDYDRRLEYIGMLVEIELNFRKVEVIELETIGEGESCGYL